MPESDLSFLRVVIVGGGFSGTLVAAHLLRSGKQVAIDMVEPRGFGRGLAYSTICDRHLLNVPAVRMSAFGSEPMHFLDWLHANGNPSAPPDYFAPRKLFAVYLQDLLQTAIRSHPRSRFRHHVTEAVSAAYDGEQARVALVNGERLRAHKLVLACGNPAPRSIAGAPPGYFASPWVPGALAGLDPAADILIAGSGLTAVDAFLALEAQGHQGTVHLVSRRGKLPHAHTFYRPLAGPVPLPEKANARELLRAIRHRVREAAAEGADWRAVIDSLRPVTNDIWCGLDLPEQRRVLRHLKTWWDIHRHRMAPDIGARIAAAREHGQLRVQAGRVLSIEPAIEAGMESGITVTIAPRGGPPLRLHAGRVINCTGSDEDYRRILNPLIRSLLSAERISPNFIGRGLRTDSHGAAIESDGTVSRWLFTVGPPRAGGLLETTAVPELRRQAESLANFLSATPYEPVEVPVESNLAAGI